MNSVKLRDKMKKILSYMFCALLLIACGGGDDAGGNTPSGSNEYLNASITVSLADNTSEETRETVITVSSVTGYSVCQECRRHSV